jgi:TetR/AcrR family transcriptional regulator, transcriptional repressor of bet genes
LTFVQIALSGRYHGRVSTAPVAPATRVGGRRTRADKYDERRTQLAISALATLGELGYAKTSLREIAQNSEFSHGVVHYYFTDKFELITHCVRYYKAQCVTRYDGLVAESTTDSELLTRFADKLVETLVDEAPMHRLWYDLRTQSMFEEQFRPDVLMIDATLQDMIGRVVTRYAELAGRDLVVDVATSYALLDGIFEKALLTHLTGGEHASRDLRSRVSQVLPKLLS